MDTPLKKVKFYDSATGKVLVGILRMGVSAIIASAVAAISSDSQLFGDLTPVVYILLLATEKYLDPNTPNLPKGIATP